MSGGYYDDGWHGGGGVCGVCGRTLDEQGGCRCIASYALPRVICDGYEDYKADPACGCRIHLGRRSCGRVVQEGDPGGRVVLGMCATCKQLQILMKELYYAECRRHIHHAQPQTPADPFEGFRESQTETE